MSIRIALVSLYVIENNGVRFLAAMLRNAGFTVYEIYFKDYRHHHFDEPTPREIDNFIELLTTLHVDLVGFSVRAGAYLAVARDLTNLVKERFGVPVIWGGPHVSFAPEQVVGFADYLSIGESEDAIVELAQALADGRSPENIANIWTRRGDRIIRNDVRPLEQNLDRFPFRDYHSHDFKYWIEGRRVSRGDPLVGESIYLTLSTRGCIFNCSYCDVNVLRRVYRGKGKFFRVRSVDNILAELRYAVRVFHNMRRIRFDDELFPVDPEWIREFARRYKAEFDFPFDILSDPRVIKDDDIRVLVDAGLDNVLLGIQAAEGLNRKLFNRHQKDETVREVAQILHRHGVTGGYQIILDTPKTVRDDRRALLDLLLAIPRPFDLYTFSMSYWPGARLTEELVAEGIITENDVEGADNKVLRQFRVDLGADRPVEEQFWIALYHLTSKRIVPKAWIRRWSNSERLRRNPRPLIWLSDLLGFAKLGWRAVLMIKSRELTWNMVRRWLNVRSPASL
ncbi:MAG: cobalamin-dependent protein [Candidatus Lernaella stagnicola]|nr:cobalamin-dependent protein [Candidatus Lernaella stagnicola]